MPEGKPSGGAEGLSLQTLVLAAASSAAAAIVVSHIWKGGTVIAAAMTPVIVSIVKELLARPMDSEMVRRPVQQVSRVASSRRRVATGAGVRTEGEAPRSIEPPSPPAEAGLTPMRTYGRLRPRKLHLKIAIVTGLIAFVIGAAALTLPELLFGGALSSSHQTTLFGGGGGKSSKSNGGKNGSTQPQQSPPSQQRTTPATPAPTTGGKTPPSTTPSSAPQQTSPQQTSPQQTTPAPTPPPPPVP
jgi:hypothetical protein